MKNLFQFLLLASLTGTLCAADSAATETGAAAVASQPSVRPTYDSALAASRDEIKRSVSPKSRPYIGTVRRLKLSADFEDNIASAEALAAISSTLPAAAGANADDDVEISGTDLAKKVLVTQHLARPVRSIFGSDKYYLTPDARKALLSNLAPEELAIAPTGATKSARLAAGIARWKPKPYVRSSSPTTRRGGPFIGCDGTGPFF